MGEFKGYENPIRVLCGLGVCGFGYDRLRMFVASFLTSQSNQNKRERETAVGCKAAIAAATLQGV